MKTIEQKAKAYDEALERARALNNEEDIDIEADTTICEYIFPELIKYNDEKVRGAIIHFISHTPTVPKGIINKKTMLAWLEKQDGHKPYGQRKECEDCQFNYAGECKGYCALKRNEHKPTDEVKPKFKVGDWIILPLGIIARIDSINSTDYQVTTTDGRICDFKISKQDNYRLWSINDAKRGDVLVDVYGNIGIFDKCYDFDWMSCCSLGNNGGFQHFTVEHENEKTYPATKEQYNLFFSKMKEAGWEWDCEKKELKKIESKMLDADKVIEWLNDQACQGWIEDVEVDKFVDNFKEDFGL